MTYAVKSDIICNRSSPQQGKFNKRKPGFKMSTIKKIVSVVTIVAIAVMIVCLITGNQLGYRILNILDPPDPNDPDDRARIAKVVPDDWYEETLKYYKDGFSSKFSNERSDLSISDEMKDENNKFGYLLRDLDDDGDDELLIGIIDDSAETKFTDLYIWHTDFGARRTFSKGEGYYMYLCEDNIIREDSWRSSETEGRYMKFNGKDNAMTILDTTATPQKFELTPFN